MTIDTTYLDSGSDKIKLARPALLAMAEAINAMAGTVASASDVSYLPGGTGAIVTNVQDALRHKSSVTDFGADKTGVADSTASFQAALDNGGSIYIPDGTYKITAPLKYKTSGTRLRGSSRNKVVINYTGTTGPVFSSNVAASSTLLWCELSSMQIVASAITSTKVVVDWKSMQFGLLDELWLIGPSSASSIGLSLSAVWAVTEATYNVIRDIYIGLVETGIRLGDGANSNQIIHGRIQIPITGGHAILAAGTVAGRVSNLSVIGVGMEYPGAISLGINLTNVNGATIIGCRFEALNVGIYVDSTSANVHAPLRGNYFDGTTSQILAASRTVEPTILACASFAGATGVVTGTARGCTVSRSAVGTYSVTFDRAMSNTEYAVSIASGADLKILTGKSTTGFTLATQTVAKAANDPATVDIMVVGVS